MKLKLKSPAPELPDYLSPQRLKAEPLVFEKGMTEKEVLQRLVGGIRIGSIVSGGIRGYNQTQVQQGQPQHIVTRRAVHILLAKSGYDHRLADKHDVGMTKEQMAEAFPKQKQSVN